MLDRAADHLLSEEQCRLFCEQGYLVLPGALPPAQVEVLVEAACELEREARARGLEGPEFFDHRQMGHCDAFFDLMDHPQTFPAVWSALGWNVRLYNWQVTVNRRDERPELPDGAPVSNWHFDGDRLSLDIHSHPRPRLSIKIGFYLTDLSAPGAGNFYVVPGSHLIASYAERDRLGDARPVMPGRERAIPVLTRPGDAVMIDRRVWHGVGANLTGRMRIALHYGYSLRWMQTKKDLCVSPERYEAADPIRQQLLGAASGLNGRYAPTDEDVPLRRWMQERGFTLHRATD